MDTISEAINRPRRGFLGIAAATVAVGHTSYSFGIGAIRDDLKSHPAGYRKWFTSTP